MNDELIDVGDVVSKGNYRFRVIATNQGIDNLRSVDMIYSVCIASPEAHVRDDGEIIEPWITIGEEYSHMPDRFTKEEP